MGDGVLSRLRALEDREAIRELIARYGPLADRGEAEELARLWEPDGIYAVAGMEEARGRGAIAALIEGPVHQGLMAEGCAHVLGPVAIDLNGDEATAIGHSAVFRHVAGTFVVERVSANRWTLRRMEHGWSVVRRDNALLNGSEAARTLLDNQGLKRAFTPVPRREQGRFLY